MLLEVLHDTHYRYSSPMHISHHQLHLGLRSTPYQHVLATQLQLSEPAVLRPSTDAFGNPQHFVDLQHSHQHLGIHARSLVQTHVQQPLPHLDLGLPWEAARARFVYRAGQADDPASDFLYASPLVPLDPAFARYAAPSFGLLRPLLQACHDLCTRLYQEFVYDTCASGVDTHALQALQQQRGVCQDFTHVMVACLRSMGLPARYVSGYLLTHPPPGQARLVGTDASHAWAEVYLPPPPHAPADAAGQWWGFCPTNGRSPADDYVVLGWGCDFSDVSPVRGVVHGGGQHRLEVAVTVRPVHETQHSVQGI